MKKMILFFALSFIISILNAQLPQRNYHVRNKVVVTNIDQKLIRMSLILPLAQTNQYQTVNNVNVNGGVMVQVPKSDDSYVRWTFTNDLPLAKQSKEIYYEFDVKLKPLDFDFSRVTTIYPYDTTADYYHWYTGASGAYVDPYNPTIQKIGSKLWAESSDILDYAKHCYEYVALNYSYLNPFTGLHTLQDILNAGGGDCGNLSSVFISLLRYKNIPARHIVTVRPDGVYHVWSDFLLEKYGWIPVDVTFKNSDPQGDFFGKYDGYGIVMTKEVWLPVDKGNGETIQVDILQSYNLWIWASQGTGFSTLHELSSTPYPEEVEMQATSEIPAGSTSAN
jgi:transglutaminase-like putative cysteine protease